MRFSASAMGMAVSRARRASLQKTRSSFIFRFFRRFPHHRDIALAPFVEWSLVIRKRRIFPTGFGMSHDVKGFSWPPSRRWMGRCQHHGLLRSGFALLLGSTAIGQRRASPGEAGIGHKKLMGIEHLRFPGTALVGPVRLKDPALGGVLEIGDHNLIQHLTVNRRILDGHQRFDAPIDVAGHPVGRRDVHIGFPRRQLMAVAKTGDARVLQKAPDNGFDLDVIAESGNPGPEPANAPGHDLDFDPRPGRRHKAHRSPPHRSTS